MVLSAAVLVVWEYTMVPDQPTGPPNEQKAASASGDQPNDQATADGEARTGDTEGEAATGEETASAAASDQQRQDDQTEDGVDSPADGEQDGEKIGKSADSDGSDDGTETEQATEREPVEAVTHTLKTDQFDVTVTNRRGGRLKSVFLTSTEEYKERGDLVGAIPDGSPHLPFATSFTKGAIRVPQDANFKFVPEASEQRQDGSSYKAVTYRYVDPGGQFQIDKTFEIQPDTPYGVKMKVNVENLREQGTVVDSMAVDIFGYNDPDEETSWMNFRPNGTNGSCYTTNGLNRSSHSGIEEALSYEGVDIKWGAIDTRYFTLTNIPLGDNIESCSLQKVDSNYLRTRIETGDMTIPAGSSKTFEHLMYLGPKHVDVLAEVDNGLSKDVMLSSAVDYGLFSFLARPLRVLLNWIQDYVVNWGLAIIILTILIKLLTWPINMKAYRSMEGMKEIQPKLQEIRDKYEDDRQKMTEKSMELFQENDVSPMGGCLPMLVQMPFLYALYIMIYYSVELYHADFIFWYTNLSAPDPYYILPAVMGAVMFVQQGMMSGATQANPQAKIMTKVMPVMFTLFMVFLPSGLVLYYSINLLIGIGQQLYVRYGSDTETDD